MIVIVKIKVIYTPFNRSKTYAHSPEVVWIYKNKDEVISKRISLSSIDRFGYKLMREGKNGDQYAFDLNFKGSKNFIYLAIEKEIKPLMRDKILTKLLEN